METAPIPAGHCEPVPQPEEEKVRIWINDRPVEVPKGMNLLEICRSEGIDIPSLCYLPGVHEAGICRVCLVEVEANGRRALQASCVYPASQGIKVYTHSPRARRARKRVVELLLSEHGGECPTCVRNLNCELQRLADEMGIRRVRVTGERRRYPIANKNPFIIRDYNKCIRCRRCEAVCREIQGVGVLGPRNRGFDLVIGPPFNKDLGEVNCISCGQCVMVCPTGALTEREYIDEVWRAIEDPDQFVVVQTAPAIQVTLGEAFGLGAGTVVRGKLAAALRRLGFDRVFTTELAADLTIVEEAHELLERLKGHGKLPLISSCSPGWVKFCEHFYPEFVDNLSTCKSPMEMFGALAKTYYAEKEGLDPKKMVVVAVMPCTAKKFEAARPELVTRGLRDVDYVLTTRELARMIRQAGIRFDELAVEEFDQPLGLSTGAGVIFATTGGVMEAAIRTAYALVEGKDLPTRLEFREFRGLRGIKEARLKLKNQTLRLAVAHGTRNARRLLERIKRGEKFHFIEIMACPGGCVGGGGQPIWGRLNRRETNMVERRMQRAQALYKIDLNKKLRRAHENPAVQQIYREFLGHPLSEKAKEILHTRYTPRERTNHRLLH
ncbi:NADH-dependent [FeFe] hydrogenase, group A6 [Desulfofundulus thermosubterraneus]|uniref:NAD(P)-dependent iron-only hydrogenase catalytic subunit n=1 Tax=Desulfofundulus thermosubterraneus DSM 16057 TaxID=1121432 RepID=A0A1M6EYE0_9FIRM|nr:NADH-dependent [FeFe] hydrogenase, group A6 [Desulfofundulus thermosubterraneus]SHI90488.1 NAD(P)-dependent iron-only hydrogenase catalytic subunit [Desulfofundulus thermosubterraneus DSM 16057]